MTSKKEGGSFATSVKKTLGMETEPETVTDKVKDLVKTMKEKINDETCQKLDDAKTAIITTKHTLENKAATANDSAAETVDVTEKVDEKLSGTEEKEPEGFFQSVKSKFTASPEKIADENASLGETNLEYTPDTVKETLKRPLDVVGLGDSSDKKRTTSAYDQA